METNDKLSKIGKALEIFPEAYDDVIKPAAVEVGKTLALIPSAVNAALLPVRQWILERDFKLAEIEKLLAQKLSSVEAEKIQTPETYVAIPALQAISYSYDSDELRELYANLLAKAMNLDTKDQVHPSFVEMIKQMSPIDASLFELIYERSHTPLIDLYVETKTGNLGHIYNLSWITTYSFSDISVSIDNLQRIGLLEIPHNQEYISNSEYDVVRQTPDYIHAKSKLQELDQGDIGETRKFIRKNALAKSFYKTCVLPTFAKEC